ncbi:hypothetical protein KIF59_09840 [Enterobacter cloacae subsp. cloacae]|nr:hypothetical protein [Enterobacter cloacae subsp. cloacae]
MYRLLTRSVITRVKRWQFGTGKLSLEERLAKLHQQRTVDAPAEETRRKLEITNGAGDSDRRQIQAIRYYFPPG